MWFNLQPKHTVIYSEAHKFLPKYTDVQKDGHTNHEQLLQTDVNITKNDSIPTYWTYHIIDYSHRSHDLLIITIHVINLKQIQVLCDAILCHWACGSWCLKEKSKGFS
jgi:hypothetical protein